jgi:hypothetical protein
LCSILTENGEFVQLETSLPGGIFGAKGLGVLGVGKRVQSEVKSWEGAIVHPQRTMTAYQNLSGKASIAGTDIPDELGQVRVSQGAIDRWVAMHPEC